MDATRIFYCSWVIIWERFTMLFYLCIGVFKKDFLLFIVWVFFVIYLVSQYTSFASSFLLLGENCMRSLDIYSDTRLSFLTFLFLFLSSKLESFCVRDTCWILQVPSRKVRFCFFNVRYTYRCKVLLYYILFFLLPQKFDILF